MLPYSTPDAITIDSFYGQILQDEHFSLTFFGIPNHPCD